MIIEAVLFDKDGTLIDFDATFEPATALVLEDLASSGVRLTDLAASIGFDLESQRILSGSVLVAGSLYDIVDHVSDVMDVEEREAMFERIDGLYRQASLATLTPFVQTEAVLRVLSARGNQLGVATNDTYAGAKSHLDALNWSDKFQFIAGCDSGFGAKPGPGMVKAFCETVGVDAARTVMVGDSAHDCSAGHAAGAKTVAIANPENVTEWPVRPDVIISGIEELPAAVAALGS